MAQEQTPHFHNHQGHREIQIGTKSFQCIGALPPLDHPHIFLDMGKDNDIICPYCSTHYRHNEALHGEESLPENCSYSKT